MPVKDCKYGTIEYKEPNVPEVIKLLGAAGMSLEDLMNLANEKKKGQEFVFMGNMMEAAEILIQKVDIKVGEKEVKTYKEALEQFELLPIITQVTREIVGKMKMFAVKTTDDDKKEGEPEKKPTA